MSDKLTFGEKSINLLGTSKLSKTVSDASCHPSALSPKQFLISKPSSRAEIKN